MGRGYNILIMATSDECWAYCMDRGGYPTICHGDVLRSEASFTDVVWAVILLAWKHSRGGSVPKKWNALPGITSPIVEADHE